MHTTVAATVIAISAAADWRARLAIVDELRAHRDRLAAANDAAHDAHVAARDAGALSLGPTWDAYTAAYEALREASDALDVAKAAAGLR
jgi:hypothetical protein